MHLIDHVRRYRDDASVLFTETRVITAKELASLSVCPGEDKRVVGKSVLLALEDPLLLAIALVELDGRARRLVITPSEIATANVFAAAETAEADVILSDHALVGCHSGQSVQVVGARLGVGDVPSSGQVADTEWVLLTSGTAGAAKLVQHSLHSLTHSIRLREKGGTRIRWGMLYDPARFAGLQVFLQALLGGDELILSQPGLALNKRLTILCKRNVTHLSATPSFWRRILMSSVAQRLALRQITLGGEIADQAVLDGLHKAFPHARITHIYASTEAGVGFSVNDGRAGFPIEILDKPPPGVQVRVRDGRLWIRSARAARRYLIDSQALTDGDGFIDTGDAIELRNARYYFLGRTSGAINVGGMKVHPEEVERILNAAIDVRMSRVYARKNPFIGNVVVADVVLRDESGEASRSSLEADARERILDFCRKNLMPHMVPAVIRFVSSIALGTGGKVSRRDA